MSPTDAGVSGANALLTSISIVYSFSCPYYLELRLCRRSFKSILDRIENVPAIDIDLIVPVRHDVHVLIISVLHEPRYEPY